MCKNVAAPKRRKTFGQITVKDTKIRKYSSNHYRIAVPQRTTLRARKRHEGQGESYQATSAGLVGPGVDGGMTIDGYDALLEFVFEATRMWRRTEQISSPEFERGLNDLSKETPQIKQGRCANFCRGC